VEGEARKYSSTEKGKDKKSLYLNVGYGYGKNFSIETYNHRLALSFEKPQGKKLMYYAFRL
jgi:hypothetical protein